MAFGDIVQTNSGSSGSATSFNATLPSSITAGSLVVVAVASDNVPGGANTGWTKSTGMSPVANMQALLWWFIAAGGDTIPTVTFGGTSQFAYVVTEFAGPFDASPYNTSAGAAANGGTGTTITSSTVTPTAGSDYLLIAGLLAQGGNNAAWNIASVTLSSPTNSFGNLQQRFRQAANAAHIAAHVSRVITGASGSYSTAATISVANTSGGSCKAGPTIAFKKGAGGGASGVLSKTMPAPGVATAGAVAVKAALSKAMPSLALSTSGNVAIAGALSATMPAPSIAAAGGIPGRSGVLSAALPAPGITSAGAVALTGILSKALPAPSVAATGKVAVVGTLSQTLPAFALAATGLGGPLPTIEGVLTATLPAFGLVATGGAPVAAPAAGGGGIPFFRPYRDEEEDEEELDEVVTLKPRRRLKKREIATTIAKAAEYIAAGSPRPMSADVMADRIAAAPVIAPLLRAERQRVERAIDRYVALMLAEQEQEEEEAVVLLLAA